MDLPVTGAATGAPEQPTLFPLPAPIREYFAEAGGSWFGWTKDHFRIMRPAHVTLREFPLSPTGWDSAWQVLTADHPLLASAIAARLRQDQELAVLYQEYRRQEVWAELEDCALVGGHGWDPQAFPTGTDCVLRFTADQLRVRPPNGWAPLLRAPYIDSIAIEFSGPGDVRTGGGIISGGFGLAGAAESMIAATVINALT
jgi:hypothetical protein